MKESNKIFTKEFTMLALATFLAAFAFLQLVPILPIFAVKELGLDEGSAGYIVAAFSITAVIFRPFVGYLLDNFNRKLLLVIAMVVFLVAISSHILVTTIMSLLLVRMVLGASWSVVTTSNATIVVDMIPDNRRAEGIGYFTMAMPMAMVIGPFVALRIYDYTGNFTTIFLVGTVFAVISFLLILSIKIPKVQSGRRPLKLRPSELYEMRVLFPSFMQFCYNFAYGGIVTFVPLYAITRGIPNVSHFFALFAISVLATRMLTRKTFDLHGPDKLVVIGYSAFATGCVLLSFATSSVTLYISGILVGAGGGIIMPALNTMAMNVVEAKSRGRANATIFTAIDIGMATGAFTLGKLMTVTSYPTMFRVSALVLLIPIVTYFLYGKVRYLANLKTLKLIECRTDDKHAENIIK